MVVYGGLIARLQAMTKSNLWLAKAIVLSATVLSSPFQHLQAQTETGQVTGTLLDPTGAVIMTGTVSLTDLSSHAARSIMTTDGIYVFPNLQPGQYELSAGAAGFQTTKQDVNVTLGSRIGLDFHLSVGQQSQTIEVAEQIAQINTETQSVGQTISTDEVLNIPTITRNPYDLVKTVGNTTDSDPSGASRGVGVSINGLRSADVGILLDGVPNRNNFDTTVAIGIPLDSVGEINVITNSFTAEYGKALAGVVNVDTKRGSNAIHGTAYEFMRLSGLTSNSFDNNANGIPISVFTRNQFGFSVGGPVIKNKLFVFANPEWLRVRSQAIQTGVIATPQLIAASAPNTQAFFSAFGTLAAGVHPLQTFTYGQVCATAACTLLPASTPAYQKVAYSVPSDSGGGSPQNSALFAGRVDYVANDATQIYFRYARQSVTFFPGTVTNSPYNGYNTAENDSKNSFVLSGTHTFSPTLLTQTKLSFNRIGILQGLSTGPIAPTLYTTLGSTSSLGGSSIIYPGYSPFTPGNAVPFGGPQNYVQLNQDATKIWGKHNIRFGGTYTYLQDNRTFGAYEEAVAALGTNAATAVNNLIKGQLVAFQAAIYPQGELPCIGGVVTPACTLTLPVGPPNFSRSNINHEAGLYVQDAWKLKPRLTLNLGVRWDYYGVPQNRNKNLDSNFYLGAGANVEQQAATGTVQLAPKSPIGGLWKRDYKDFSPRLGFAYDVFGDGKTAVRGGYGIGYEPNFGNVTFNVIQNPPNYGVLGLTAGVDVPTIPITNNNAGPLAGSSGTKPLSPVTLRAVDPNIKTAYAQLWNAALEHQIGGDIVIAAEYNGSKGSNLYAIDRLNVPGSALLYSGTGTATTRSNSQYSYINFRTNGGFSNYNSLNLRAELRNFRKMGLTLRSNYTWSHAIDNISNTFSETVTGSGNLGVLDPLNPGLDKGNAEFDVRHRVNVVAIYAEPFKSSNKILNTALGGWSLIPNFSARVGTPFTVWDCTNAAYVYCPRVMYDSVFHPTYTQTATANPNVFNYMNLGNFDSSYVNKTTGVADFGPFPANMTGRGAFTTPGVWNVDLAAHKSFDLTERFKLEFRAEAFNALNHSNLYIVYSNTDASATQYITASKGVRGDNGTRIENRNLQLALKLLF
jgi:outer membrane receptor protein involved in Fe transport